MYLADDLVKTRILSDSEVPCPVKGCSTTDCPDSIQAEINEFESIKKLKNFF
jgi:hypothetical protein